MHWIVKMAFLLFYLRIAHTKIFTWSIYATIATNCVFTVIIWMIYCFQCIPLDAYFNKAAHPTVQCLPNKVLYFVPAALSIFTDLVIFFLPLGPLWTVKTSLRNRIMLIGVVSLGGLAVLVSILRIIVLLEFETTTDFTYTLGKMIIISAIEIDVAIIAANGPALKTLFVKGRTGNTRPSHYGGSHELSSGMSRSKKQKIPSDPSHSSKASHGNGNAFRQQVAYGPNGRSTDADGHWRTDSEEKLFQKNEANIVVTSSIGVESRVIDRSTNYDPVYNQQFHGAERV